MDIDQILKLMVEKQASDLHLAVGETPMFRINSRLFPADKDTITPESAQVMLDQILTNEQKQEFDNVKELDFSYEIPGLNRFRFNLFCHREGLGAAVRIISNKIPTPKEIDLTDITSQLINLKNGLVLVTGPTGSGKSTSLASIINTINTEHEYHIITIEDPIEFVYPKKRSLINQRELNNHTLSYQQALKHILRQDSDVVLIGEMRDLETISAAITLAETGCLVFATLHTMDAAQTIDRIVDVFPSYQQSQVRLQLSMVLKAVLSQQLLPRKDGKGLIAAREILITNKAISNLIREHKTYQIYSALETGRAVGMITMEQAVTALMRKGTITRKTALKSVNNPQLIPKE